MGNLLLSPLLLLRLHHLLLLLSLSSNAHGQFTGLLPQQEVDALNNITKALEMKMPRVYSRDYCQKPDPYDGIFCNCDFNNSTICHILRLEFESQDLRGIISPAVVDLQYLQRLDLSGNMLHGSIPATVWNLSKLENLDLASNQLEGYIPDVFGDMQSLWRIDLSYNFLEGPIPPSFGALPRLINLYLNLNRLTGPIPSQLGNISTFNDMHFGDNQLNGTIPGELGKLSALRSMQISGNNFTEKLPPSFGNLTNLSIFAVRGNNLCGPLDFMANWTQLQYLHLIGNSFEGPLPPGIINNTELINLWVTDMRISTSLLEPLSKLTALKSLILRNCSLDGIIPKDFGNMNLNDLDLSFNNLTGKIPNGLQKLDFLCLARNNFDGPIPDWAQDSDTMNFWDFSHNTFANGNLLKFNESYVNSFNCCTPTASTMQTKNGKYRDPSMEIRNETCPDEKYYFLYINCGGEGTTINGSYYEEDNGNFPFYLSPNKTWARSISGDFITTSTGPEDNTKNTTCGISASDAPLYATARISPLTLDYYGLCLRNGIYHVTLHFAEIVFTEEIDHTILGKRLFDIVIQGETKVKDFDIKAEAHGPNLRLTKNFTANVTNHLLNIHFYWAGKGSIYAPLSLYGPLISAISVTSDYKPSKKLSFLSIALLTAASISLPPLVLALLYFWGRNYDKIQGTQFQETPLTVQDIVNATQKFCDKKKIGRGSSGRVYKADLRDGSVLAVKVLERSIEELTEFSNEVRTLESLNNDNLVKLLGWYIGTGPLLLIYEYMEKECLHNAFIEDRLKFSWRIRHKICLDIARGLYHLHEISEKKIIHRDIKPSNILLDGNLKAKISDFGLARFYNKEVDTLMTKLHGTHGYMAPEYAQRGVLSEKN